MNAARRTMTPAAWALLAVGVLGVLGAVVWLGAADDGDGDPLIENPGAVLVAIIGLLTAVLSIVLPQLRKITQNVQNDHTKADGSPLLLRDDLDGKHDVVMLAIEGIRSDMRGMRRDIGRNTDRAEYVARRLDEVIDRVGDIEDTITIEKESPR